MRLALVLALVIIGVVAGLAGASWWQGGDLAEREAETYKEIEDVKTDCPRELGWHDRLRCLGAR